MPKGHAVFPVMNAEEAASITVPFDQVDTHLPQVIAEHGAIRSPPVLYADTHHYRGRHNHRHTG